MAATGPIGAGSAAALRTSDMVSHPERPAIVPERFLVGREQRPLFAWSMNMHLRTCDVESDSMLAVGSTCPMFCCWLCYRHGWGQ